MECLFHKKDTFKINTVIICCMVEAKLDEKDFAILDALRKNAKRSVFQLAKKTGIPPTTVHNRINKLRKEEVIKNYTIEIDREKIGHKVCALVSIFLNNSELESSSKKGGLARQLREYPNVGKIFETTGSVDIIVQVYGKDIKEISEFVINNIREVKGVGKTETVIALSEK